MAKTYKSENQKLRPAEEKNISKAELQLLQQKISNLITRHPDKAVIILTEWIRATPLKDQKK